MFDQLAGKEPNTVSQQDRQNTNQHVTQSPFAQLLGFEPVESKPGHVILRLPFSNDLRQSLGRVHGGVLFSLADHASGWAAYSTLEHNERCATLEMKINFIAAVSDEDCLAEARVVHKGRTSIVVESEIKTVAGRLVAKTLATFIVLKHKT
jgi:acyl-CoA thioesterase